MAAAMSALPTHDAAFDEHHDESTVGFVVAQAVSSGCRQRLTLFEGLPVSCSHVVHHLAHTSRLLSESGAADAYCDDNSSSQSMHGLCLLCNANLRHGRVQGGTMKP